MLRWMYRTRRTTFLLLARGHRAHVGVEPCRCCRPRAARLSRPHAATQRRRIVERPGYRCLSRPRGLAVRRRFLRPATVERVRQQQRQRHVRRAAERLRPAAVDEHESDHHRSVLGRRRHASRRGRVGEFRRNDLRRPARVLRPVVQRRLLRSARPRRRTRFSCCSSVARRAPATSTSSSGTSESSGSSGRPATTCRHGRDSPTATRLVRWSSPVRPRPGPSWMAVRARSAPAR